MASENSEERIEKVDSSEDLVEQRKQKIKGLLKGNINWIFYLILALITGLAVYIRTRNINGLKDIATGTWTLGPDLDPFLFLRWAEYIVEHGSIMVNDTMRYVPLGYDTSGEMKLLSYMIAWFYQGLHLFSKDVTVTYAAIIFPVVMFALTCIAFFFLTKEILKEFFEDKKYVYVGALIATLFLAIIPSLLPRTIAGIPEKESVGFLFIFLSFLFIIKAFNSKTYLWAGIYGILGGIATAALGLTWGGVTFVYIIIGFSTFVYFIIGNMHKKELFAYTLWIATFLPLIMLFSTRMNINVFITSISTIPVYLTWVFAVFNIFIYPHAEKIKLIKETKNKFKLTREFASVILAGILLFVISLFVLGPMFIPDQISHNIDNLVKVASTNRFAMTVAENKQPYFSEWANEFGPVMGTIPIFFSLFLIGSVFLFYNIIKKFEKREKILLIIVYILFIIGLIFSRFKPESAFNGTNSVSIFAYIGSIVVFFCVLLYIIYKYEKENKSSLLKISIGSLLCFVMFFMFLIAARSSVRTIMMLVPAASIMVAYFIVYMVKIGIEKKDESMKTLNLLVALIVIIASLYSAYYFYSVSKSQSEVYAPQDMYHQQWQKAMSWVRTNTSESAVFGHWWDYGYWVQSIGKRATVLDGGNAIVYWDHLMGRYALTGPNDKEALEFLYTHNTTHFLIDSTDIGKYAAFSSIGADENYDRYSYIPTFFMDTKSTIETVDGRVYVYGGGVGLDEDIIWQDNGTKRTFTKETSGIGGITFEENSNGSISQPKAIFVQQGGNQIQIPLKYLYYKNKLYTFNSGLDAGIFLMPTIGQEAQQLKINDKGALLYLSNRTVHSLLARKYLFGEEGSFKLVLNEPNSAIAQIRAQGADLGDFAYYGGSFLGPIKIWEIEYPSDIKVNPEYLRTDYPNKELEKPQEGYY
jgi:asparagine N-glycosylation enzyme membrane subunit Stt3